jgi:predicted Zn-dependent protease
MRWISKGVLTNLAYSPLYGLAKGKPYATAASLRLGGGTATLDDMIASCDDGIYVNRLSNVDLVDQRSGLLTGVTRDGCFHIKGGKIGRPVKNFRFLDSPIFALNRLEMIGAPRRVAFGQAPPSAYEAEQEHAWPSSRRAAQWPRLPVIAPPIMVADFNLSALSDAV